MPLESMKKTSQLPSLKDDDYPSVGMYRQGYILVCHGDDTPCEWESWLEPLVTRFLWLASLAEEYGVKLSGPEGGSAPESVVEFCDVIGIEMTYREWQGYLISGTYWLGWLKQGTLRTTKAKANALIASMTQQANEKIRPVVIDELLAIEDLESFLERTADDRSELRKRIEDLQSQLLVSRSAQ